MQGKRAREVSFQEHEKWVELCDKLERLGAVTVDDRRSFINENGTPGQQLFHCIREWGKLMAEVAVIEVQDAALGRRVTPQECCGRELPQGRCSICDNDE